MDLTEHVAAAVSDAWGLVGATLTRHDAGMNSRTWWVDHRGGRAVAKWVPERDAGHLRAGAGAARLAATGGLETGCPLPTDDGDCWVDTADGTLVLLSMVEGTELTGDDPDDPERIGTALARAHRQTVGHRADGAWELFWVDPAADHLARDRDVQEAVGRAVAAVNSIPGHALTTGLGHGDPAPEAFLRRGPATALIDWGSAVNGPLVHDLASAAMYLGGLEAAAPMLAAYGAGGGPVPAAELAAHGAAFLDWRWAVQADYFAGRLAEEDTAENRDGFADARRRLVPA